MHYNNNEGYWEPSKLKWSDLVDKPREIDRLIAEKVMGFEWQGSINGKHIGIYTDICKHKQKTGTPADPIEMEYYSIDISAAWEVVEKMTENNILKIDILYDGNKCFAKFFKEHWKYWIATESTAPLAICHAALLALNIVED